MKKTSGKLKYRHRRSLRLIYFCVCVKFVASLLILIVLEVFFPISLFAQYEPSNSFSTDNYQFEPIKLPGGKLENVIQCVAQDSKGVLWFGTQNGLIKYDGRTYFQYYHNPLDSNSLISNYIECIFVDHNDDLWIGTFDMGFTRFTPSKNQFKSYSFNIRNGTEVHHMGVNTILRHQGYIWLGTHNGVRRFNPESSEFKTYLEMEEYTDIYSANVVRALYVDKTNTLWMGMGFTWNPDQKNGGLYKYLPEKDDFIEYKNNPKDIHSLSDNRVKGIFEDSNHNFWIGTMASGLHQMNRKTNQFKAFPYQPENPNQLSRPWIENEIYRTDNFYQQVQFIHEDFDKNLWIGDFDSGLNIYNPTLEQQIHFERGMNGLETNNIWNIFETQDNTIFICTGGNGAGKNYKIKTNNNRFSFYRMNLNLIIKQIVEVRNNQIWLGGVDNEKIWQFNPENKELISLTSEIKKQAFLSEFDDPSFQLTNIPTNLIREFTALFRKKINKPEIHLKFPELFLHCVKKDRKGNIWIGTWGQGLFRFNIHTKESFHYLTNNPSGISGNHISTIYEDKLGNIWVGGGKEAKIVNNEFFLDQFSTETGTFIPFYPEKLDYGYPPNIAEDQSGNLWYPTVLGGIHRLDPRTGEIKKYNQTNSLIRYDDIRALVIDREDNIWMTSEKSIIQFDANRQSFIHYGEEDGIKVNQFEYGSGHINKNEIYFGGQGGFHHFSPNDLLKKVNTEPPQIIISEFSIKKRTDLKNKEIQIKQFLHLEDNIELKYIENTFSIGFNCIDYQSPEKVYLEYQLENYDWDWRKANNEKTAQYYNLPPGEYRFKVRGTNGKGLWSQEAKQINIVIHPPWWKTKWAYTSYFLAIGLFFYLIYFVLKRRLELQNQLRFEKEKAKRLADLDEFKTRLNTNITHEFRTPLTVILGVTQNLKDQFSTHLVIQDNLSMVERNAQQLLKFINQLLDLSKLDNEKVKVNWELGDVVLYLQYLSESFHSYAKSKQIQLTYYPETKSLTMDYDHEKIQQVISNLLSNAIKFTPNKGKIFFHVNEIISNEEVSKRHLQIKIFNSGQGIAAEHLPHLFDRFYQIDSSHTRKNEGTGIGLALTKELVELMQGQISVKSELGKGTEFIVNFPVRKLAQPNPDFTQIEPVINTEINTIPILNTDNSKAEDIPLLLLIEDNPDVAAYIQSCLSEQYKVLWAENGQLGIDKALEIIPDVIISDVMMPEKNGFEVTQFLKNDERTSHIPIILLTAKADIDSKIAGLERGADAYLSKPFDKNELLIRLRKLVALRQHLQSYYGGGKTFSIDKVSIAPTEKTIQKDILIENEFLKKINKVIEKHLSDSDFEIPNLCRNLHMSQSQLYRKLKALTGKTIVAYLRSYRLHKAKEWLQNSDSTVSSIAYDVGFTDPAYFSRMFSEEFGRPPSESRK